jgi:hypothetical protein
MSRPWHRPRQNPGQRRPPLTHHTSPDLSHVSRLCLSHTSHQAKAGAGSATLSMAYAAARFADSCLRALAGEGPVAETAYVAFPPRLGQQAPGGAGTQVRM